MNFLRAARAFSTVTPPISKPPGVHNTFWVFGGGALAGSAVTYFFFAQNPRRARDAPSIKKEL